MEGPSRTIPLICLAAEVSPEGALSESRTCSAGQCMRVESVEEYSVRRSHHNEWLDHALGQILHSQTETTSGQRGIVLPSDADKRNRGIWRANNRREQPEMRSEHEANRFETDAACPYSVLLSAATLSDSKCQRIVPVRQLSLAGDSAH
jgi:hypothetical protein